MYQQRHEPDCTCTARLGATGQVGIGRQGAHTPKCRGAWQMQLRTSWRVLATKSSRITPRMCACTAARPGLLVRCWAPLLASSPTAAAAVSAGRAPRCSCHAASEVKCECRMSSVVTATPAQRGSARSDGVQGAERSLTTTTPYLQTQSTARRPRCAAPPRVCSCAATGAPLLQGAAQHPH